MEPLPQGHSVGWGDEMSVVQSFPDFMPNVGQLKKCPSRSHPQEIIKQQKWFKEALENQDFRASAS
jgi:hypothetical protein